jgi:hypothetical protein
VTTVTGTLKKNKKGQWMVVLSTKKGGIVDCSIPRQTLCFRPEDGHEGLEVSVEKDQENRILKVVIPGKPVVSSPAVSASRFGRGQSVDLAEIPKAHPSVIGLPFHNPYTFLPFPQKEPKRRDPTPLSMDEKERERLTGVLDLEVTTLRPLLTCRPEASNEQDDHRTYEALTIGGDVIIPATGVRGALRTLLTILTGGTLGYLDRDVYLCQGRDVNLGPGPATNYRPLFLGWVEQPGNAHQPGVIRLGETKLVKASDLSRLYDRSDLRRKYHDFETDNSLPRTVLPDRQNGSIAELWVGLGTDDVPVLMTDRETSETPWKVKLSGQPVQQRGVKREGVCRPGEQTVTVPAKLWAAYTGLNVHGDRKELKRGDLVWLELKPGLNAITKGEDIRSLQWARLGRRGQPLEEAVPPHVRPDYRREDGRVDEVTDLFGQVALEGQNPAPSFAARVRPENLVFFDTAHKVKPVTLAPLAPPHPGCVAFYREETDPDKVASKGFLRGYKVYRTNCDEDVPWLYETQGVYGKTGELKPKEAKVNKTCDLLPEGSRGMLRIAFRALTKREIALLLLACHVPWRLGGGKPIGLGLCLVMVRRLLGEDGRALDVSDWTVREEQHSFVLDGWVNEIRDVLPRAREWMATQQPVKRLRYPRAVQRDGNRITRGGHVWFGRHASPRKEKNGLTPLHIEGQLLNKAQEAGQPFDTKEPTVAGQTLPPFLAANHKDDCLYGYDGIGDPVRKEKGSKIYGDIVEFDPKRHVPGSEHGGGSHGKDGAFRRERKRQ